MLTAALLGCLLGLRHASDPDHVAAVSAIVAHEPRPLAAARVGAVWGLGHGATVMAVGAALLAFRLVIPGALAMGLELGVAVVLMALGLSNLRALRHTHDAPPAGAGRGLARTFAVGVVHGLAGSAAVALLALAAMPDARSGMVYLAVFGLGTTAGMVAVSLGLGLPCAHLATRPAGRRWLLLGTGALAIVVGLHLAWGLGIELGAL